MPTDQQVTSKMILDAVLDLERRGPVQVLRQLEALEPDLTGYFLENLTLLFQRIMKLGGPIRQNQRLLREIQSLTLICILALRNGHREIWQELMAGTPAARIDPDADPGQDEDKVEPSLKTDLRPPAAAN